MDVRIPLSRLRKSQFSSATLVTTPLMMDGNVLMNVLMIVCSMLTARSCAPISKKKITAEARKATPSNCNLKRKTMPVVASSNHIDRVIDDREKVMYVL